MIVTSISPGVAVTGDATSALDVSFGVADPLIVAHIGEPFALAFSHVSVV